MFSYLIEERQREIGIRMALGAGRWEVRRAIFSAIRRALAAGTLGGFLVAFIVAQLLRRFLFGMSTLDPISYLAVGALLVTTALLATYVPVRRALRANPATTLRSD